MLCYIGGVAELVLVSGDEVTVRTDNKIDVNPLGPHAIGELVGGPGVFGAITAGPAMRNDHTPILPQSPVFRVCGTPSRPACPVVSRHPTEPGAPQRHELSWVRACPGNRVRCS